MSTAQHRPTPHYARWLLAICGVMLVLCLYHTFMAVIIAPDGAVFLRYARELGDAPLATIRGYDQHPLYPMLIALVHAPLSPLAGDSSAGWIASGRIVAIAGSLAAVVALYWFTARVYGRRRALLAAGMLAVLPDVCHHGADVLSDLPHLAFYLTGLAAILTGVQTRRWAWMLVAGLAGGLAFLTRPEGGAVFLIGLGLLAWQTAWPLRRRAAWGLALLVAFGCVAGPYQLATGSLIQKKSIWKMFGFEDAEQARLPNERTEQQEPAACISEQHLAATPSSPMFATNLPIPINVIRQWARAGRVIFFLLAILGVFVARPTRIGGRAIAIALGVHVVVLYALEHAHGYLDRRHALILITMSLPLAAAGVWWIAGRIARRFSDHRRTHRTRASIAILAGCAIALSYYLLVPSHRGDAHVRAAADWLAESTAPDALIVGDSRLERAALFAERPFAMWPWWGGGVHHLDKFLAAQSDCIFVVDHRFITSPQRGNAGFFEQLAKQFGDRMQLLHTIPGPPDFPQTELRIYQYQTR